MAFISFSTRVVEHRARLVCLGFNPSPRVSCTLPVGDYYYVRSAGRLRRADRIRVCARALSHRLNLDRWLGGGDAAPRRSVVLGSPAAQQL